MAASVEFNSYPTIKLPRKWKFLALSYNIAEHPPSRAVVDQLCTTVENANFSFVVISLQEIRPAERMGMKMNQTWREQFHMALWEHGFMGVCSSYMMTNLLMVYTKTTVYPVIDCCKFSYSKDLYNGAKGTIGVVIKLRGNDNLMFLGSHFAHDASKVAFRIAEAKCVRKLVHKAKQQHNVKAVVWMGDLNFRNVGVDSNTLATELENKDEDEDFLSKVIDRYDQMLAVSRSEHAFHGFEEAPITFKPTYRMLMGTSDFDLLRVPSWTDRILFDNFQSLRYDSLPQITYSDHSPVFSELEYEFTHAMTNQWDVRFEPVNTWYAGISFQINFDGKAFWNARGSVWDWLGVYQVPNVNDRCAISFTNIMLCVDYGTHYMAEFMILPPGDYLVAYHSYHCGCIKGISNIFTVKELAL
ncbi:Endonuclease/exonuclease/phosphatase family protein [Aphelenchoides fujianensis]|nr:Endonuclease/exonuclease/phosphatase family protein [Aphelenchoides fujianensis]